jgi:hypothetical protein
MMNMFFGEGTEFGSYSWEAHKVTTSTGYEKTLFRLTGDANQPDLKTTKQPVLYVNGATSNVISGFAPTFGGFTVQAYIEMQEGNLLTAIKGGDPTRGYSLQAFKDNFPDRWAELASSWEQSDQIKLDDELASAPKDLEG